MRGDKSVKFSSISIFSCFFLLPYFPKISTVKSIIFMFPDCSLSLSWRSTLDIEKVFFLSGCWLLQTNVYSCQKEAPGAWLLCAHSSTSAHTKPDKRENGIEHNAERLYTL